MITVRLILTLFIVALSMCVGSLEEVGILTFLLCVVIAFFVLLVSVADSDLRPSADTVPKECDPKPERKQDELRARPVPPIDYPPEKEKR